MKLFRGLLMGVLLAVLLALLPTAFAQEDTLGLSADDFALWQQANATSAAQTSFNYAFTLNISATGLGQEIGDIVGRITGSGAIGETVSMITGGELSAGGETIATPLELRVVGDSLYIAINGQWFGSTLEEIGALAGGLAGSAGLPVDPADLAAGDLGALGGDEATMQLMSGLAQLQPSDFVSGTRLADTADGFAVIEITVSIADLLVSDAFAPLLSDALMGGANISLDGAAVPTVDPVQAQMAAQMVGAMFADATFAITQTIDPVTGLVQNTVIDFNLPLGQLMAMGDAGAGAAADAALAFTFDISLSDYGAGDIVEAPAAFSPLSEMMQNMDGMMGMTAP